MFFGKRKNEVKPLELLYKKNIRMNCPSASKEAVIRQAGQMLCDTGYVDASYIDAMVEREKTFSTHVGNGIALPHGVEEAKKAVKSSGIAVMTFPDGVDWGDGAIVKLVVGVAGVGDAHLEILANIAMKMAEPEDVERLIAGSADDVYKTLTEEA